MAILGFGSTRQSLFDQVSITLADGFHHIGRAMIEFHNQPLGRSGARRYDAGNIDHALAQGRHRCLDLTWSILDMQQWGTWTKATHHVYRILPSCLYPVHVDFEEYIGIKVFEHHIHGEAALPYLVLKPMIVIPQHKSIRFGHFHAFIERVTDTLDP